MQKLALAIIAKNEVEKCYAIIEKYGEYFDEIAIAYDERKEDFEAISHDKVKVFPYIWINDFSDKRNFLASKIESEYYFRLDTDDIIENPQNIRALFDRIVTTKTDLLYVVYDYAKDVNGNCIASHWRETIIRRDPTIYWKKAIHENIHLEDKENVRMGRDTTVKIIHDIDYKHCEESFERNVKYLLNEFKRDGEKTDPRTIAYLGRMLAGKEQYNEAILFLEKLVEKSGWDDDKYFAWVQMSQCYQALGKMDTARACCDEALAINTKFPDAFLQMGNIYLQKGDYDKAVDWFMPGIARPQPDTVMVIDPCLYTYKGKANAALALLGKGDVPLACKIYADAVKAAPENPLIKKYAPLFIEAQEEKIFIDNLIGVGRYIQGRDKKLLKELAKAIPPQSMRSERIAMLRNTFAGAKKWDDKSVVFYCGNAWEQWADCSTINGIGGSEEAVIYMARELTDLGYKVTVYNMCGDLAGTYYGVEYKNFFEFNQEDNFNILISWRHNIFKTMAFKAKRKLLWLHDVPQQDTFTEASMANIDRVIVLSEFHRSLLPSYISQDKVFVSSNGINLVDFDKNTQIRNPKRMIYTSSYDRGIQHLLQVWADVKTEVPDAELHLFYGWNTYDEMMRQGMRPTAFRNIMTELMKQDGITEHGRVGHKQLVRELQKSGLWVYPSHFEEISCISAMKAQAAGCVPVCTDYAALNETVKTGIKIEGSCKDGKTIQRFKEEIIKVLKDEKIQEKYRASVLDHKDEFGWDRVATQWSSDLFQAQEAVLV